METYFCADMPCDGTFWLSLEESKHLTKVRRHQPGDRVRVVNGRGLVAQCELLDHKSSKALLRMVNGTEHPETEPCLHLAVSPLHHEDRWEWLLEKATELGVHRITPLSCERTGHFRWKLARYERILESALKQSLRTHLPLLEQPVEFPQFRIPPSTTAYVAHCDPASDAIHPRLELDQMNPNLNTCLIIGPEGDFSPGEIQSLIGSGAIPLSLGSLRLRTETAVLAALSRFLKGSMVQILPALLAMVLILMSLVPGILSPAWAQTKTQRDNSEPVLPGHIALGRLKYQGGGDWYANPTSLPNLARFCNAAMGTTLSIQEEIADVGSPDLFRFPWIHMTGHGRAVFNDQEARNLRTYLIGGGFLHVDDNYGMDPYVRSEFKKVFPELEWIRLPDNHPVYLKPYPMPGGLPKIHEHDGRPAEGLGLVWQGRLIAYYSYQCDLGDGWEDSSVHRDPEALRTMALQMGANLIRYAFEQ
jgi:RsmE family RNA methyltransferase